VDVVVECGCGWVTRGEEDRAVEAMQVHGRQIHGVEITRDQVLAKARSEGRRDDVG
jgi:predicted small metal-binding protein